MGSEPGNVAPPNVEPAASSEILDLPQNIRSNIEAMGSITGLKVAQKDKSLREM